MNLSLDNRQKIDALAREMIKQPQLEIKVTHRFAPGIYAREIMIPKGATAVGKIHKIEHINIISQGDVTIVSETGSFRVQAPYTVVAGTGRCAAYAHEDTVWTTILPTDETDPEKIEALFIEPENLLETESKDLLE